MKKLKIIKLSISLQQAEKIKLLFLVAICLQACVPNFSKDSPEKLFYKKIKTSQVEVQWYIHSLLTSNSADYVTLLKNGSLDTICIADNVYDVNVSEMELIRISFYGKPKRGMKIITIPNSINGCQIFVDTLHVYSGPKYRSTFKE